MALTVETESRENAVVVHLRGRLDAAGAVDLEPVLLEAVAPEGVTRVVLECADLKYVSSAGLRVVLKVLRVLQPRGGKLYACAVDESVTEILRISGFTAYMELAPNLDACLT